MKRLSAIIIIFTLFLSTPLITFAESENELPDTYILPGDVIVYADKDVRMKYLEYIGTDDGGPRIPEAYMYYYYDKDSSGNVTTYPAYCKDPDKPGAGAGSYTVDASTLMENPKIWGIVTNGYPYKSYGDLDLINEYEAYFATKMALWTFILDRDINDWIATEEIGASRVLAACKKIYNDGMKIEEIPKVILTAISDKVIPEKDEIDSNYVSLTYNVTSNMAVKGYKVSLSGDIPEGTIITDIQNNEKNTFKNGDSFKVLIHADSIADINGTFQVKVAADLETKALVHAISYDKEKQDYVLTGDSAKPVKTTSTITYTSQSTILEIIKKAAGTNIPLEGALFRVSDSDGIVIGTFTTDGNGRVLVPLTKSGTYQIDEITPPKGYLLSEVSYGNVNVSWGINTTVTFTNEKKPGLSIQKIDSDTGRRIGGAVVRIAKDGGSTYTDIVMDSSGVTYLEDMEPGVYTVTEIIAPAGYLLDDTPQIIRLEAGNTATITLKNKKRPGIIIRKYDEMTSTILTGAEFSIAKKGGSIIHEGVTDENGMIQLADLEEGWYTITELAPPEGYIITTKSKDVYLEAGKTAEIKFDNRRKPSLQIIKIDEESRLPIAGAVFKVRKAGSSTGNEYTTDAEGLITINNLEESVYIVEETKAPEGYLDENLTKEIELTWGILHQVIFTNKAKPALEILKVDEETNQPLAGAKFRIKEIEGGTVSDYITGADGKISIIGLEDKIYTVEEITAPDGYLLDTQHRDVKLEWGRTTKLVFTNKAKPSLEILKIDEETKEPLKGAKFKIMNTEGKTVGEYVTDNNGLILIRGLEEAVYSVEEIIAPEGYLLETQHKDIALEWGKTKTLLFTNKAKPALEILKIDEGTRQPLKGAKFRVIETEGTVVGEYITDEQGRIRIPDLKDEIYTIEEIAAPDGYLLETQHKDVKLEWGKTTSVIFTNKARPALEIKKIDTVTGKPLAGARFRITKTESLTVSEYITDENGLIHIKNLDEETYTVEEIAAPYGYVLNHQSKEVQLEWGKTKTLVYENTKKPTLIITKISGTTFQPIPNTTFKIEYEMENGGVKTLGEMRTDKNGQIIIQGTDPGWYIITETKAAPGYSISSNPVTRKYLSPGENAYTNFSPDNTGNGNTSGDSIEVSYGNDYQTGQEITDYPLNSLIIRKISNATGELLSGAVFELRKVTEEVTGSSGTVIERYTTNYSGIVVITGLEPGGYIVEEVTAPDNYLLSENSMQQVWMKADGTSIVELTFANIPYGNILVTKVDALTGKPLADAKFRVTDGTGAVVGTTNGIFTTNENGEFIVSNVKPSSYVITEIEAPEYYTIDTTPQTIHVGTDGKTYQVGFKNQPSASILIRKRDTNTRKPLENAQFKVIKSSGDVAGTGNGIYTTDADGTILIPNLEKGSYIIEEIKAPDGYILENQTQTVAVDYGKTYTMDFYNKPMAGVVIKKTDSQTKQPLAGASFKITKKSGEEIGTYQTDGNGIIQVDDLEPDWYSAVEVNAPDGYLLDSQTQDFEITHTKTVTLNFENHPKSSILVKKFAESTKKPLAGAEFTIKAMDGTIIGSHTTGNDGTFQLSGLDSGWYIIQETKAPEGYLLDGTAKKVEVTHSQLIIMEFYNLSLASIQIIKTDAVTNTPLAGAEFNVTKANGEEIGTYRTDTAGKVLITDLEEGTYIISEIKAPKGYMLNETPKTVVVKSGKLTIAEFTNKPYSGIQIIKVDAKTGKALAGAVFHVTRMNGETIGTYKTDKTGQIYIPSLEPDWYSITETKAPDGYFLNSEPRKVQVTWGKTVSIEIENQAMASLLIQKTDSQTGEPLKGVTFAVSLSNGERIGTYTTDTYGRIYVNQMEAGKYHVTETKALEGYSKDNIVHEVVLKAGTQSLLEVENEPLGGIRLTKINSVTQKPIHGVEFMLFDSGNKVVGVFYTDNNGRIDFPNTIPEGRYTIRETRAARGYDLDSEPKTVEFKAGKVTEIVWENTPQMGQIQITKKSGDENEMNGFLKGTPLSGAVFEVYDYKTGNLIDRFISGNDGRAVSNPLPLGRYTVKEVKAPLYYKLSDKVIDIELEYSGQIIKREYVNYSVNLGVYIKKTGNYEAMPGDTIGYQIKAVQNTSAVPLSDFYWRDVLPTDAVRLNKIVTGTYNQSLKYKILAVTNKGDTIIIADNLSTTKNNVIDCSRVNLGLARDEYIVSFTFIFGTVKAKFAQVVNPQVFVDVVKTLPNKYEFANKCDIGGRYDGEWIITSSTWKTTIYSNVTLPKTGY